MIIGSGPAGVAAAMSLISLGKSPVMIDAGLSKEDDYFRTDKRNVHANKTKFGSDLAYRHFKFGPHIFSSNSELSFSFSSGGLSEVWGATFLPFADNDIIDWPINLEKLHEAYEFVASKIPVSTAFLKPLHNYKDFGSLGVLQLDSLFDRVKSIQLNSSTFELGATRLAVRAIQSKLSPCQLCGECLRGCPYGSIWSAKDEIPGLISEGLILLTGKRVVKLRDDSGRIYAETINKLGKREYFGYFDQVFVAAGNVETFRILAASNFVDSSAILDHSTTFYFPSISLLKSKSANDKFGLSQLFLRLQSATGKSHSHFQMYACTDALIDSITARLKVLNLVPYSWLRRVFSRVIVTIGYRDGAFDSELRLSLTLSEDVKIEGKRKVSRVRQKIRIFGVLLRSWRIFASLGLFPLFGFLSIGRPGNGVHAGSWLFKSEQCNEIGSVGGHRSVYVIDSSSLPTIPNGPITMTVMANAVRIVLGVFR